MQRKVWCHLQEVLYRMAAYRTSRSENVALRPKPICRRYF